jgi:putative transposase
MKEHYPKQSIAKLCRLFGKSRHSYYDRQWRDQDDSLQDEIIMQTVLQIRTTMPRLGTRKLLHLLAPQLASHHIKIGRDYLFDLLEQNHLLIRQRKRKAITTNSRHWMRKYSNLVKQIEVYRPEQVWVSDITYIRLRNEWGYLSLITDAYSRRIMGFCFRTDLSAAGCINALQMALSLRQYPQQPLTHHSDRGSQYCSADYVDLLTLNNISISMTENSDPYENALAERINGIIKNEFNLYDRNLGFNETYQLLAASIKTYNEVRPHSSCDYLTPMDAHQRNGIIKKRWKNYNTNYDQSTGARTVKPITFKESTT